MSSMPKVSCRPGKRLSWQIFRFVVRAHHAVVPVDGPQISHKPHRSSANYFRKSIELRVSNLAKQRENDTDKTVVERKGRRKLWLWETSVSVTHYGNAYEEWVEWKQAYANNSRRNLKLMKSRVSPAFSCFTFAPTNRLFYRRKLPPFSSYRVSEARHKSRLKTCSKGKKRNNNKTRDTKWQREQS